MARRNSMPVYFTEQLKFLITPFNYGMNILRKTCRILQGEVGKCYWELLNFPGLFWGVSWEDFREQKSCPWWKLFQIRKSESLPPCWNVTVKLSTFDSRQTKASSLSRKLRERWFSLSTAPSKYSQNTPRTSQHLSLDSETLLRGWRKCQRKKLKI